MSAPFVQVLKKTRLVWQSEDIPRSLIKLSTAYCGNSLLKSRMVHDMFENARFAMENLARM